MALISYEISPLIKHASFPSGPNQKLSLTSSADCNSELDELILNLLWTVSIMHLQSVRRNKPVPRAFFMFFCLHILGFSSLEYFTWSNEILLILYNQSPQQHKEKKN